MASGTIMNPLARGVIKKYNSYSNTKITGTTSNQLYLIFGLSGTTDTGTHLAVLFKQGAGSSTGYIRSFGGPWYSAVNYSSNSYEITFTNLNTYTTLYVLSLYPFTIS